jgi:Acyltransferase family
VRIFDFIDAGHPSLQRLPTVCKQRCELLKNGKRLPTETASIGGLAWRYHAAPITTFGAAKRLGSPSTTPRAVMTATSSQRDDIQGLRAIAVLAVIVFHLNSQWLPGGFIGVDIFFVVSGFLMASIKLRQEQRGPFSFVDFYVSRMRRIVRPISYC